MSTKTKIEWCRNPVDGTEGATWNPTLGCTRVSAGCDNCYAIRTVNRMSQHTNPKVAAAAAGLVMPVNGGGLDWTGEVNQLPARLSIPLRWRKSKMIFVNSQSDLFHPNITDDFIAQIFAVMAVARQHVFLILTKRHARMRSLLNNPKWRSRVFTHETLIPGPPRDLPVWPLPNVWMGVSIEDQHSAFLRIDHLHRTPAAVRFLSVEPLVNPIDLDHHPDGSLTYWLSGRPDWVASEPSRAGQPMSDLVVGPRISWVICGGESGPRARPMDLGWVRAIRDQCAGAGTRLFVKQLGTVWASEHGDTDHKGGTPGSWPQDLRIREFPDYEGPYHA